MSRRAVLLGLAAGAVAGAGAEAVVHDARPDRWIAGRLGGQDGSVRVHGGDDSNEARENTLAVWNVTPSVHEAGWQARYFPVGSNSDQQVDIIRNKLAGPEESDLVVIDPEYLPGLVGDHLVAELPDSRELGENLRGEGCFASLLARCRTEDDPGAPLYALPLNADAPLLVVDLTRFDETTGKDVLRQLQHLQHVGRPGDFWLMAGELTKLANGPEETRRILVQNGPYEGMTVSLVELISAFGGDVKADPALEMMVNRRALDELRRRFPTEMFARPARDAGDESATLAAVQEHRAVFARLWPSHWRQLLADSADEETYAQVPIPGGVLGGQVIAVARNSGARDAAVGLAGFLARGQSQSQLFHVGGYVPTLSPFFTETTVKAQLPGLATALNSSVQRPYIRQYGAWSTAFRESVRPYLLGQDVDVDTDITQVLQTFVHS